jgi:hypothetical protein
MIDNEQIRWPGSGSLDVDSLTVFGSYNGDSQFQKDCIGAAKWACFSLGYDAVSVELTDRQMYPAFEEACNTYNAKVNEYNMLNNMLALQGQTKSSMGNNATGKLSNTTGLQRLTILARDYGSEIGSGGNIDWKKFRVPVMAGQQDYDLQEIIGNQHENCNRIEIKKIFHDRPPAFARIYDPMSMTGMSYSNVLTELGFGAYSPAVQFLMCPIFEDLLRGQAIQFNDLVRKSAFSFQLINNKLRLFPIPTFHYDCWVEYTTDKDKLESGALVGNGSDLATDFADIPYQNHKYSDINASGRQWIRKYFLANCKEILGSIRKKYATIPIPGSEIALDGNELASAAQQDKTLLMDELKLMLEQAGKFAQTEKLAAYNTQIVDIFKNSPLMIYSGIFMLTCILIL